MISDNSASKSYIDSPIPMVLSRKSVKNINISISRKDGSVGVSAPKYVPEAEILRFVTTKLDWIKQHQERILRRTASRPQIDEKQENQLRDKLQQEAEPIFQHYQNLMGVEPNRVRIRKMASRWGSCSRKTGIITLNLELIHYPHQALEYVIVHELAHLIEMGHGSKFQAVMDKFLPDWRNRRKALRN